MRTCRASSLQHSILRDVAGGLLALGIAYWVGRPVDSTPRMPSVGH